MNLRVTCFHLMVRLDYGASRKPPKNTLKKFFAMVTLHDFMSFLTLKYLLIFFILMIMFL